MPSTPRSSRARLRAALLALASCACGEAPVDAPLEKSAHPALAIQLLARRPDAVLEDPGELRPRPDYEHTATWGEAEGQGWSGSLLEHAGVGLYRETNQPTAGLKLQAGLARKRELELELWCTRPALADPGPLQIRLNGMLLASPTPAREPRVERFEVPRELWADGENLLEFVVPEHPLEGARAWDTLALSRASVGPEQRVNLVLRGRRAELPATTGLCYFVQTVSAAELVLEGTTDGPGTLAVTLGTLDPGTGRRAKGALLAQLATKRAEPLSARLELPEPAGAVLTLELAWTSASAARLALERLDVVEQAPVRRPPIVFVSIDTFAARHLALYGHRRPNTPVLTALAEQAVVFERCVANAPWTLPSYLSVMTGLYPQAHRVALTEGQGVRLDQWDAWQLAQNRWTLAEALRARGYQTTGLADSHWLSPKFHFDQGFDLYDIQAAFLPAEDPFNGIAAILQRFALPWVERRTPDVPWLLFVHALDSHGPYWPAPPFLGAFANDAPVDARRAPAGAENQSYGAIPAWMARSVVPEGEPIPPELPLGPIVQRYDETILEVDAYLGRLFQRLRALGVWDQCVIVVTGDHGESFDHGFYNHGAMWEDVLHVPLLIKLPDNEHGGRRVAQSVQLVDLYPTLLELAGAHPDPAAVHGRSLLPLIRGEKALAVPTFSEGGNVEQYALEHEGWKLVEVWPASDSSEVALLTHPLVPREWLAENCPELLVSALTEALHAELSQRPGHAARLTELRRLLAAPSYELYDLHEDPRETRNLAGSKPEVLARLQGLLAREKARGRAAQAGADPAPSQVGFSHEQIEALRALGYVGD